jgi:hypothetical protein
MTQPRPCCLCPNPGGALKPTEDGLWAHVACALWIPELSFGDDNNLTPIIGMAAIPKKRQKLVRLAVL